MVASRELDVAVVRFPADDPNLRRTVVGRQAYTAVLPASHPLAGRDSIPLAALAAEPFILWPRASATAAWDAVFASCVAAGFVPTVHQQTVSVSALLALVAAGLGVTLLAEGYAALERRGVRHVRLTDGPTAPMELVARADEADPPVLAAFRELVIRRFAEA